MEATAIGKRCSVTRINGMNSVAYEGTIQAFSTDYEELQDGVGLYPVVVILCDDGTLRSESIIYVKVQM